MDYDFYGDDKDKYDFQFSDDSFDDDDEENEMKRWMQNGDKMGHKTQWKRDRYKGRKDNDNIGWRNKRRNKWKNADDMDDQWEDFMEDIAKCDNRKRCGKKGLLPELSSCICQSFWSKNSDPTGRLCQAIPKETRQQLVKVISMFIKETGPTVPMNYTVLAEGGKLWQMWQKTWEKHFMLPFEKQDMQVI